MSQVVAFDRHSCSMYVYLLYMNMESCDYSVHYGEAMHVKHAASVETQIGKE